jgi:hypothetical protein
LNKHRYETPRHPIAFGLTAVTLTLITFGALVVAPAEYGTPAMEPTWAAARPGPDVVAVTCQRYENHVVDGEL